MWASCCTWLCMDSDGAADEVLGAGQGRRSFSSPAPVLSCRSCGGHWDAASGKHVCSDCGKNFCGLCSAQLELRPRLCHTCQRFYGNLLERAELMKLKVKELRDYLHLHEVPTHLCREKEELVELVVRQRSPPETLSSDPPSVISDGLDTSSTTLDPEPVPTPSEEEEEVEEEEAEEVSASGVPSEPSLQGSDSEEPPAPGRRASLSDLSCAADIQDLSVRQLKEILARNFVDYKGCCEKWELMERVVRLYRDQRLLREGEPASPEENLCRICMDSPIDCVLLECGHMITCTKCGKRMSECPICRQYVIRAVHVFRS